MATRAERHEVVHLVGDVNNQVLPSWGDMMNVKRPPASALGCTAHAAYLVPFDDSGAYSLPSSPVHQPPSAFVVRVLLADHAVLSTSMAAKASPTRYFAGKGSVGVAAILACLERGCNQSSIAARFGTMPDVFAARVKGVAARLAERCWAMLASPFTMAFWAAEMMLFGLLDDTAGALE